MRTKQSGRPGHGLNSGNYATVVAGVQTNWQDKRARSTQGYTNIKCIHKRISFRANLDPRFEYEIPNKVASPMVMRPIVMGGPGLRPALLQRLHQRRASTAARDPVDNEYPIHSFIDLVFDVVRVIVYYLIYSGARHTWSVGAIIAAFSCHW